MGEDGVLGIEFLLLPLLSSSLLIVSLVVVVFVPCSLLDVVLDSTSLRATAVHHAISPLHRSPLSRGPSYPRFQEVWR